MSEAQSRPSPVDVDFRQRIRRTKSSLRITLEGIILLAVILLVGFAAWHSGTNLLYLIFSILVAFYLVHGFVLKLNLHSLAFTEIVPEVVVANAPFDLSAVVTNRKRFLPSYGLRLSFNGIVSGNPLGAIFFPVIPRSDSREGLCVARIPTRGLHTVGKVAVSTRYPFGFEERTQSRFVDKQILALPPTYGVAAVAANIPFGFGDQESSVRGAGTDLYGLREYVAGEPARHVHWRTSARLQKLMVSEYTRDERRQVILLLDNGVPAQWHSAVHKDFENAVILTASLARHLIETGFEVGVVTTGATLSVGQGAAHLLAMMRHLALIQLEKPSPLPKIQQTILWISFHSHGQASETGNAFLSIDSRTWTPPPDQFVAGEKLL